MTIRSQDAAVWGDSVTPNVAIYAFLFCHYGCREAICTIELLDPGTCNIVLVVQGHGYRKMTIRPKDAAVWGERVQYTHFCSAIMGVKVLYGQNSPWPQGPVTHSMGSTGSWLP